MLIVSLCMEVDGAQAEGCEVLAMTHDGTISVFARYKAVSARPLQGMRCHRDGFKSIAVPDTVTMTVSPPKSIE